MSKTETDRCNKIEIWRLLRYVKNNNKYTTISWGENGSNGSISVQVSVCNKEKYVRFIYTQTESSTGENKDYDYMVPIVETPCHFGGTRYWFKCNSFRNNKLCGQRVGVLYRNKNRFECRLCSELIYSSQKINKNRKLYPMFKVFELTDKIETLELSTKRRTYRKKPTKKQEKIKKLCTQFVNNYSNLRY